MSVVSVYGVANYSEGELKLISQGENAVDSQHVTDVMYDGTVGIVWGKVCASMKNKAYNVQMFLFKYGVLDIAVALISLLKMPILFTFWNKGDGKK